MSGKFIAIEGTEAAGKTLQCKLVKQALEDGGYPIKIVRLPGSTPLGEELREILKYAEYNILPIPQLLLFAANYHDLYHSEIEPLVADGCYVLCDRYDLSMRVYQGCNLDIKVEDLVTVCRLADLPYPDMTLFLDISAEESLKRLQETKRRAGDRWDNLPPERLTKIAKWYQDCARETHGHIRRIDGEQPIDVVTQLLLDQIIGTNE